MKFKNMFSPIQIGPMTVKNRFVVPPMGNNFANTDGTWSDESVAYYAERAKGQFGLITIEATVVHKGAKGGPRKPCLYDDNSIESLKKITDAWKERVEMNPTIMQKVLRFPFSFRMPDLKEMPRMREHQSRQQQLLQRLMEEIFRKQFLQSRYMSLLKDMEKQRSAQ